MKLIVCSDSHGNLSNLLALVEKECPDLLLHLGDTASDAERLQMALPELNMYWVVGNCDGWRPEGPEELSISVEGRRIFMLHGHTAHVKSGYGFAVRLARAAQADILLFGHTHIPLCTREGALWMLNPGSIRVGDYGIIVLANDTIHCQNATLF